jgi:hypothetical protein
MSQDNNSPKNWKKYFETVPLNAGAKDFVSAKYLKTVLVDADREAFIKLWKSSSQERKAFWKEKKDEVQ